MKDPLCEECLKMSISTPAKYISPELKAHFYTNNDDDYRSVRIALCWTHYHRTVIFYKKFRKVKP